MSPPTWLISLDLRAPTPFDWFLRGELAASRGQLDEAIAALDSVPEQHHLAAQARLVAGQVERRRDRLRLAESAFSPPYVSIPPSCKRTAN